MRVLSLNVNKDTKIMEMHTEIAELEKMRDQLRKMAIQNYDADPDPKSQPEKWMKFVDSSFAKLTELSEKFEDSMWCVSKL